MGFGFGWTRMLAAGPVGRTRGHARCLTDYCKVDRLVMRYKSVNFGAETRRLAAGPVAQAWNENDDSPSCFDPIVFKISKI